MSSNSMQFLSSSEMQLHYRFFSATLGPFTRAKKKKERYRWEQESSLDRKWNCSDRNIFYVLIIHAWPVPDLSAPIVFRLDCRNLVATISHFHFGMFHKFHTSIRFHGSTFPPFHRSTVTSLRFPQNT